MSTTAESEARKALQRLRRSLEKSLRELRDLEGALAHAEADDFPVESYEGARARIEELRTFVDEEPSAFRRRSSTPAVSSRVGFVA